jgi:formylglycine-generating enzyme required for sulfatase activity
MPAGIFISYRRREALAEARGIYERLRAEFGHSSVFIDLEGLDYGEDFVESLDRQLQHCQVLIALIGPQWLATPDGHGGRRLDDENDFVRIELRTALQRGIRVVPVLLNGAVMPRTSDLPADLQPLLRRQALELDFRRFDADIARLVGSLRRLLTPAAPAAEPSPTVPTPSPVPAPTPVPMPEAAPTPAPTNEPAAPPVRALLSPAPGAEKKSDTGAGPTGAAGGLKSKTVGIAAGAAVAVLGAVWLGTRTPNPAPAPVEPVVAAASTAASAPAPVVPASAKAAPAPASSLTAAEAEVLRRTRPEGQEIFNSLQLKPKEPPPQPKPLTVGQRFRDCDDDSCPWMVVLPAGSFTMGSPESEPGREKDEGPQHRVQVASFAIGQYEVTFRQWDACVAAGGCKHKPGDEGWGRGQRPVINVSWNDAQQYVKWLNSKTGQPYRLPSEAEWEYAARAGTSTPYAFGESLTKAQANFGGTRTLPVGSLAKNRWDLYDLHGNAWEWVQDCWHSSYQGAPSDGRAWLSSCGDSRRLMRGGSWYARQEDARSSRRLGDGPIARGGDMSFRLARVLP